MTAFAGREAQALRAYAGIARMLDRGIVEVTGTDRARWLDGMLSNDVGTLRPGPDRSGCYATLLTAQGRIVADPHVLARDDCFWLELARAAVPGVIGHLDKYIVADDVALTDRSAEIEQLGLEGPAAPDLLAAAVGLQGPLELARDGCVELSVADVTVVVAAFGYTGEAGYQLLAPTGGGRAVAASLHEAARADEALVEVGPEALEILRIEAGIALLGPDLDESVLPDEAGLDRAISTTKGCYTGQEIVARLRSQGKVAHRMVGLCFGAEEPPPAGSELYVEGRRSGEVTSVCVSPVSGAIGLGYVRAAHAEPGQEVMLAAEEPTARATVAALPFVGGTASE